MFGEHWLDRDCDKCKHKKPGGCTKWDCEYEPIKGDLISRKILIDRIEGATWYHVEDGKLMTGAKSETDSALYRADVIYDLIDNMPGVENKIGKWEDEDELNEQLGSYFATCSECGYKMDVHENRGYFKYCPNCGANMTEPEEHSSKLKIAKDIIKKNFKDGDCGLFKTGNFAGDSMTTLYRDNGLHIDICYPWAYFEVFGLTEEEFIDLKAFYKQLEKIEEE